MSKNMSVDMQMCWREAGNVLACYGRNSLAISERAVSDDLHRIAHVLFDGGYLEWRNNNNGTVWGLTNKGEKMLDAIETWYNDVNKIVNMVNGVYVDVS